MQKANKIYVVLSCHCEGALRLWQSPRVKVARRFPRSFHSLGMTTWVFACQKDNSVKFLRLLEQSIRFCYTFAPQLGYLIQ